MENKLIQEIRSRRKEEKENHMLEGWTQLHIDALLEEIDRLNQILQNGEKS